jgi:hypothetical protein
MFELYPRSDPIEARKMRQSGLLRRPIGLVYLPRMGLDTAKAGGDKEHRKDRPSAYSTRVFGPGSGYLRRGWAHPEEG